MERKKKEKIVRIFYFVLSLLVLQITLNGNYEKEFEEKISGANGVKKVDLLIDYSIKYQIKEEYKKAKNKTEAALSLAKKINYIKGIVLAQNNLARISYRGQNYNECIFYANLSLNNRSQVKDQSIIANNLKLLGMCYYNFDNYKKSKLFFNDSLKIYKKIKHKEEVSNLLSMLGDVSQNSGEFEDALDYYLTALRDFEYLKNNDGISNILISIGDVYISIKNYKKAEETLKKAYEFSIKNKDTPIIIDALSMLGEVYKKKNNSLMALRKYQMAYKLALEENDKYQIAGITNNIGEIHRLRKDYSKALESYKSAYDIFKKLDYTLGIVTCSLNIGLVYLNKGSPALALEYFNKSLNTAKSIDAKSLIRDAYEGNSDAYVLLKNYKSALKYYKLFTSVKDELFTEKSSKNMAEMQTKYETEKKENEIRVLSKDKDLKDLALSKQKIIRNSLYIGLGFLFLLAFLILNRYRLKTKAHKALTNAHNKLEIASDEISEKNEKIVSSIRYAERIQNAILPLEEKISAAFPKNFMIFLPKDIVSGDFYWFSEIGNIKFITIVDCTGHGVPGAFMSMIGNSLLNQIVNEQNVLDPANILDKLSSLVKQALKQEKGEGDTRDGMDMCFCKIEEGNSKDGPDSIKVTYVGAKRPLFIVKNDIAENEDKLVEIKGDRKSIGGYQKKAKAPFKNNEILLNKGDSIYLTSDGFVDQHNLEEKKFGSNNLRNLLVEIASRSVVEQKTILQKALTDHRNGAEQQDDISLFGIKF